MNKNKIITICVWSVLGLSLVVSYGLYIQNSDKKVSITDHQIKKPAQVANIIQAQIKNFTTTSEIFSVVRVVDGDTIVVNINGLDEKVRLIGINTPETVDPRKPVECFGKEASDKTKELLNGQKVVLKNDSTQSDRDKYGRLLRYIYRSDGLFINQYLVEEGFAYEYTYRIPYIFQKEFKEAQSNAELDKKGLWADGVCNLNNI